MNPKRPFIQCSITCTNCGQLLAATKTIEDRVPRRRLTTMARERGAVTDKGGNWYCGPLCRTDHRMHFNHADRKLP